MATMSKKHYVMIADALSDRSLHLDDHKTHAVAGRLADEFERDNPRFDRQRFMSNALQNADPYWRVDYAG